MSNRTLNLTDTLYDYVLTHSLREHPAQAALRDATRGMERASMQISPEQGQFMALLVKLMGAHNAIEVGVFTGYSALSVALALPPGGRLLACDISEEYTSIARSYWEQAGVADRIDLQIGPALETLRTHLKDGEAGLYDFAFIDADKVGYDDYYECCLQLVRPGGLIVLDNTLRNGSVIERADNDDTAAIQALNIKLRRDERIDLSMLPISDGLTLARRR